MYTLDYPEMSPLGVRFNQKTLCFSIATPFGFQIYHVSPMERPQQVSGRESRQVSQSGCEFVELLDQSNFMALVFTCQKHKVFIWDDAKQKMLIEMEFHAPVRNVILSSSRCVFLKE